jgi:NTP pyrophosphatase (non-canonical NTP hydrolase)
MIVSVSTIKHAGQVLRDACYLSMRNIGWHTDPKTGRRFGPKTQDRKFPERLALMHSELSEALEGHRKGLMDDKLPHRKMVEVELADCVIRIFDCAGAMGLDVAGAIAEKLEYNLRRADHKPEARLQPGGKKY